MKLFREPLLHFAVAGAALFGAHGWLNRGASAPADAERTVRIGEREVAWLAETWTRQRQRPPSQEELQGLVTDYLKEELLAREARALELDRDDTVVRRRLAQKMEFLLADTTPAPEPTDAELRALHEAGRAGSAAPARTSFVQVFFSPDARGERAANDASALLARLERGELTIAAATELGDRTLLPPELTDADEPAIAALFGNELARAVAGLEPGVWRGPIRSSFGLHLVRVEARSAAAARPFEQMRTALTEIWRHEREAAAREEHFAGLLEKYEIQVAESVRPLLGAALDVAANPTPVERGR